MDSLDLTLQRIQDKKKDCVENFSKWIECISNAKKTSGEFECLKDLTAYINCIDEKKTKKS